MNEPAVFESPEKSFPKDNLHFDGKQYIFHGYIHNLYGQLSQKTAYQGLLNRYEFKLRPFVLSRSFYAGTQKYGFIWTGDNRANYDFLKSSIPTIQTVCASGLSACGADVGGFFKEASEQLLKTWYSLGVFYPFFRAHAHNETSRREPYYQSKQVCESIKNSIKLRYNILLYFYTKFFEHCFTGDVLVKPLYLDEKLFRKYNEYSEFYLNKSVPTNLVFGNEFIVAPYFEKIVDEEENIKKDEDKLINTKEPLVESKEKDEIKQPEFKVDDEE